MQTDAKNSRCFTEAAREAAAVARRRKREHKALHPEEHAFAMVVVRAVDAPGAFAWQIRRFGRMDPVARSPEIFGDAVAAGRSGRAALAALLLAQATAE